MSNIAASSTYTQLTDRCPLRPLRSEEELGRAIAVIDQLVDQDHLNDDEEDYLEVIGLLVENYESNYHPLPNFTAIEMIKELMQDNHMNQKRLANECSIPESTLSEILNGRRKINLKIRAKLAFRFKVNPTLFMDCFEG